MKSFNQLLEQSMYYLDEEPQGPIRRPDAFGDQFRRGVPQPLKAPSTSTSVDMRPATVLGYNVNTPKDSPEAFKQERGIITKGTGLVDRAKMGGDKLINLIDKNKTAIAGGLATVIGGGIISKFFPQGRETDQRETEFDTTTQRRMASDAKVKGSLSTTAPPTNNIGAKTAQASASKDRIKIAPTKFNTV